MSENDYQRPNRPPIAEGDMVEVIKNLFVKDIPDHRRGLIVQISPSDNSLIVDEAYVMFPDACRTLHICHLRKIFL